MRTLYESLLDDDLGAKTDIIVNIYSTTINVFGRQKEGIDPLEFFEFYRSCLDNNSATLLNSFNPYKCSKEEFIAIHNYINLMHKKYGQKDIYLSAWSLYEGDWQMYEIHKGMKAEDKGFVTDDLNMWMTSTPSKIDQWICGIDGNNETSWFMATLKAMKKDEKEAWLQIMKAVEKYLH
jgi:hypothetical protein